MWLRGETDVRTPESIISLTNIQRSQHCSLSVAHVSILTHNLSHTRMQPPFSRFQSSEQVSAGDSWFVFVFRACQPVDGSGVTAFPFFSTSG